MSREWIFDIEADGLFSEVTKIHCLSYASVDNEFKCTLYTKEDIIRFFELTPDDTYIGHFVLGYDFKTLEKIYGIKEPKNVVDTLGLSWYLYPERAEHGLESWGEEFGVKKPEIEDWQNLSIEEYTNRCETDVEINRLLWIKQKKKLEEIYS